MSGDKLVLYVWITTHGNSVLTCWYRTDKLPVILQAWKGHWKKAADAEISATAEALPVVSSKQIKTRY